MNLHIVSRLSNLYDRLVGDRGVPAHRASAPRDQEVAHTTLSVDQLAYGEDALPDEDSDNVTARDHSDPYGIHIPPAADDTLVDDDSMFATGENWVESLETRAAEIGPLPEHELDIIDGDDGAPPSNQDRPIADRGSGGPRGR